MKNISIITRRVRTFGLLLILGCSVSAQNQPISKVYPGKGFTGSDWSAFSGIWGTNPGEEGFPGGVTARGLNPIIMGTGPGAYARFPLRRYSPRFPGSKLLGCSIRTNQRWSLKDNPVIEFTATIRIPQSNPSGTHMAFYVYNDKAFSESDPHSYGIENNEIDFEMPRHLLPNKMWLNLYRNGNGLLDGIEAGKNNDSKLKAGMTLPAPVSFGQWFSLKIRWKKSRVTWSIGDSDRRNYRVVRDINIDGGSNSPPIPDSSNPVGVQLEIWSPPQGWFEGSGVITTTRNNDADEDSPIYFDVREVRVAAIKMRAVSKNQRKNG